MKRFIILIVLLAGCQGQVSNGIDGSRGPKGDDGVDGTIITIVQFCPGVSHYPTTFPETGFCIDSNIYAVYSANDGFLTMLPLGNYYSNAIGSSCNFKVLDNCQTQPL